MSSVRLSNRVLEKWIVPRHADPSLALVGVRESDCPETLSKGPSERDSFYAGICALNGQLRSRTSRTGEPLRSVGITSCFRNEGKSTIASHLAAVAAEAQRVLCIDANPSRALVHRALQEVSLDGIAQSSGAHVASESLRKPAFVPTAEATARAAAAHPTMNDTRDLLQRLCAEFDLLIVDLSPLDAAGALEWAPLLDGTVLVVEAEHVRWQMAARGIALLEQAGANVLGTVLNKRRDHIPQWLYDRL